MEQIANNISFTWNSEWQHEGQALSPNDRTALEEWMKANQVLMSLCFLDNSI